MQAKEAALLFTEALGTLSPQLSENLAEKEDDLQALQQRDASSLTHLPPPELTPPSPSYQTTRGGGAHDGEQLVEDKVKYFSMCKI